MSKLRKPNVGKRVSIIENKTRELVEDLLTESGFSLWDVVFEKEGAMWYLRVLFDKNERETGGITADECENITGPINEILDKQDFISEVDILEIGSPGLLRKLRHPEHFTDSIGMSIRVAYKDKNHKTHFKYGILKDFNAQTNEITLDKETIELKETVKVNIIL